MTRTEYEQAVLATHARLTLALAAADAHAKQKRAIDDELKSAEAAWHQLCRVEVK